MDTVGSPFSMRMSVGADTPTRCAHTRTGSRRRLRAMARCSPSMRSCTCTALGRASMLAGALRHYIYFSQILFFNTLIIERCNHDKTPYLEMAGKQCMISAEERRESKETHYQFDGARSNTNEARKVKYLSNLVQKRYSFGFGRTLGTSATWCATRKQPRIADFK
jgi:hypothetical protein